MQIPMDHAIISANHAAIPIDHDSHFYREGNNFSKPLVIIADYDVRILLQTIYRAINYAHSADHEAIIAYFAATLVDYAADSVDHVYHAGNPVGNAGILQKMHSPYVKWNG